MTSYLLRRVAYSVFVLWGAVTVVFVALRVLPSDPAQLILGPEATAEQIASLREQMDLDEPLAAQYVSYLGGMLSGDFGMSYRLRVPAMELVLERFPATAALAAAAMALAVTVGLALGIVSALRVNRPSDRAISVVSLALQSLPQFWIGLVLILVLARAFKLLPSGGNGTPAHYVLPAITLSLAFMALLTRLTRSGLLEVINEGYIQTARAKGLNERTVIYPHAIRNALIPIVTVVGLQSGQLLGGAVIVETVFAWPGVGRLLIEAMGNRDYDVVQASVIFIAVVFVVINLVVDLLYGVLDPTIRLGGKK